MQGVRGCPYCGGEVEVVKLVKRPNEKEQPYRIECRNCRALVSRGQKFPVETVAEGKQRIHDYDIFMEDGFAPRGWGHKHFGGAPIYDN